MKLETIQTANELIESKKRIKSLLEEISKENNIVRDLERVVIHCVNDSHTNHSHTLELRFDKEGQYLQHKDSGFTEKEVTMISILSEAYLSNLHSIVFRALDRVSKDIDKLED